MSIIYVDDQGHKNFFPAHDFDFSTQLFYDEYNNYRRRQNCFISIGLVQFYSFFDKLSEKFMVVIKTQL